MGPFKTVSEPEFSRLSRAFSFHFRCGYISWGWLSRFFCPCRVNRRQCCTRRNSGGWERRNTAQNGLVERTRHLVHDGKLTSRVGQSRNTPQSLPVAIWRARAGSEDTECRASGTGRDYEITIVKSAQAGRGKRVQYGTERQSRPCL